VLSHSTVEKNLSMVRAVLGRTKLVLKVFVVGESLSSHDIDWTM
jgi:hypothetical protein